MKLSKCPQNLPRHLLERNLLFYDNAIDVVSTFFDTINNLKISAYSSCMILKFLLVVCLDIDESLQNFESPNCLVCILHLGLQIKKNARILRSKRGIDLKFGPVVFRKKK